MSHLYSFRVSTTQGTVFKNLFEVLKLYMRECNVTVSRNDIKFSARDKIDDAATIVVLQAHHFDYFECNEPAVFGLDIQDFYRVLKTTTRSDTLDISIAKHAPYMLEINLSNETFKRNKMFRIGTLDLKEQALSFVGQNFDGVVRVQSVQLLGMLKDMHMLESKCVEITVYENALGFRAESDRVQLQFTLLSGDQKNQLRFEKRSEALYQARYKLLHLLNFARAASLCQELRLSFGQQSPLRLEYDVADLGTVGFVLMPQET